MEQIVFIKNDNYYIPGVYTYPDEGSNFSCILLLHGLLSCKSGDGFLLPRIADRLKDNGIASLRIDFCSCGESRGSRKDYNILTLINEAKLAYKDIENNKLTDSTCIGILGHSYGGIVTFELADLNPKCLISLNGAMKSNMYEDFLKIKDKFINNEYILLPQSDGRIEMMYKDFYIKHNEYTNNYPKYEGNVLMCIGEEDIRILPKDGEDFFNGLHTNNKELIKISKANHTFNAKTNDDTKLNELLDKMLPWLEKNLK